MTVLILAGTLEARQLAQYCARNNIPAHASLSGATRNPRKLAVPTRVGGFGGADGFKSFVKEQKIQAVLDLTHPFAKLITKRTFNICRELNLPMLRYDRPKWLPLKDDLWRPIKDESEAAQFISPSQTVFLATGRQSLLKFKNIKKSKIYCRQIDPPDQPFPWKNGDFIIGRPPFTIANEKALFTKLKIDILIAKNAGGKASRTKLDAARALRLPVLMIDRPSLTSAPTVSSLREVKQWLGELHVKF